MLTLERRYHLGAAGARGLGAIARTARILDTLRTSKIEDRSGSSRDFDCHIFRLLRALLPALLAACTLATAAGPVLLISADTLHDLLGALLDLARLSGWSPSVQQILHTTVRAARAQCPQSFVKLTDA